MKGYDEYTHTETRQPRGFTGGKGRRDEGLEEGAWHAGPAGNFGPWAGGRENPTWGGPRYGSGHQHPHEHVDGQGRTHTHNHWHGHGPQGGFTPGFRFQRGPWAYGAPWGAWAPAWTAGWARGNFGPMAHEHHHHHGPHSRYSRGEQGIQGQGWQENQKGSRGSMMPGMTHGQGYGGPRLGTHKASQSGFGRGWGAVDSTLQELRSDLADLKRRVRRMEKRG